jgi:hypothetical protein
MCDLYVFENIEADHMLLPSVLDFVDDIDAITD